MSKPRLLMLSHVFPFPGNSGQRQRVFYMLKCAKKDFHVTLLSISTKGNAGFDSELKTLCDETILLPPLNAGLWRKIMHKVKGAHYSWKTGLKFSNYVIGQLEFSPQRIFQALGPKKFDGVLFEYWHTAELAPLFRSKGTRCVLDMHDILWKSYERQVSAAKIFFKPIVARQIRKYKTAEENAWRLFDKVIAINEEEGKYVRKVLGDQAEIEYVPMGIDLSRWSYGWCPERQPHKLAYYGGLSSPHNKKEALRCYHEIMPQIWRYSSDAEFWIIGANPPPEILKLSCDSRVKVTGYIEDVGEVLKTMSILICPWTGTYGFRSRLVEAMAVGVPVVATSDAVYGMSFQDQKEIFLGADSRMLAEGALELLKDPGLAERQSKAARIKVENAYGLLPYQNFFRELYGWFSSVNQPSHR